MKKLLTLLLSVSMVATLLVGCGGAKTEEAPATENTEDAAATTEEVTQSCRKVLEISEVMQEVIQQYVEEAQAQINISHAMVSNDVYILKWLVVIEIMLIAFVTIISITYTR